MLEHRNRGPPRCDPEVAARKLLEIANGIQAIQDRCIHIEKINGPMLFMSVSRRVQRAVDLAIVRAGWRYLRATIHTGWRRKF